MSKGYGWQCESAIIPKSQSRAINNVDGRSLLALKALATSSTTGKRKAKSEFDLPPKSRVFDHYNNNQQNKVSKKNTTEQDSKSEVGRNKNKSKEHNNNVSGGT